jgi:site-specific DNA-methyltransferase (adenine-specific)
MTQLPFPDRKYDIIYADPPWPYYGDPNKMGAAGKEYKLMTLQEIKDLPVRDIANRPSVLFLWTTSIHIPSALEVMEAWDFQYRGMGYIWIKTSLSGKIIQGMGVRPSFTKPTSEYLLIGATNARGRTFPLASESQPQVVLHHRLGHSEKPQVFRELIETLFLPETTKIELFARKRVAGWDGWGLEYPS